MLQVNQETLTIRSANEQDRPAIEQALVYAWKAAQSKDWVASYAFEDRVEIASRILAADPLVINESYLLVYDICDVWHSPRKALNELLCLRLYKTEATFDVVIRTMEQLARENDCFLITVATALHHTNDELAKRYEAMGFKREEVRLYKTIGA